MTDKKILLILSVLLILLSFGALFVPFFVAVPQSSISTITTLSTVAITTISIVCGFWFGSSVGSKNKDKQA